MSNDAIREFLEGLTYQQLLTVRALVDQYIRRRRDNVQPADAVERVGRGRMFLPIKERK